jgi:polar amino acid transport system substrate-binding protein
MKYYINMFLLTIILFIIFLTLPSQVHAEDKISITVATDATWPPMEMVDENKNIIGFDIDYLNAIAKEVDINVIYKNVAWDGIFAGIGTGKYDAIISSVTITDERKRVMDFSKPYVNVGQVLIVPKATKNIKKLSDLKGQNVGAQIGTTGAIEIKKVKDVQLKSYDEIGLAFEDLMSGRIRGVVCDLPTAANYALQRKEYKEFLKIVGEPFTNEYYGIAVKKGNKKLLELLNKGIDIIKSKGIDKQLEAKWFR